MRSRPGCTGSGLQACPPGPCWTPKGSVPIPADASRWWLNCLSAAEVGQERMKQYGTCQSVQVCRLEVPEGAGSPVPRPQEAHHSLAAAVSGLALAGLSSSSGAHPQSEMQGRETQLLHPPLSQVSAPLGVQTLPMPFLLPVLLCNIFP